MSGTDSPTFLDVEIQQAHFNIFGQYFIKISIHGSTEKQNDVKLFVNNSKTPQSNSYHTTEPCLQSDPLVPLHFTDSILTFHLPPGFTDQEVHLIAEAYKVPDDPLEDGDKCGEATLLVYPNRDSLFHPTIPSETSNEANILCRMEKQLVFTSESEMNGVSVNVGSLWLSAVLRNELPDNTEPVKKHPAIIKKYFINNIEFPKSDTVTDREKYTNPTSPGAVHSEPVHTDSVNSEGELITKLQKPAQASDSRMLVISQTGKDKIQEFITENFDRYIDKQDRNKEDLRIHDDGYAGSQIYDRYADEPEIINKGRRTSEYGYTAKKRVSVSGDRYEDGQDKIQEGRRTSDYGYTAKKRLSISHDSYVGGQARIQEDRLRTDDKMKHVSQGHDRYSDRQERSQEDRRSDDVFEEYQQQDQEDRKFTHIASQSREAYSHYKVPDEPGPSTAVQQDSGPSTPLSGMVLESPLGPLSSSAHPRHLCGSYVAREGYCEVAVLVHAAIGLPVNSDGRAPQPFVTGKCKRDADRGLQSQCVTHTSIQPTYCPSWDEVLLIEFPKDHAHHEELILSVADHPRKELLVDYRIPVSHLRPYHQYNLELVKCNQDFNNSSRLYVSLILKHEKLVKVDSNDAPIFGMEVLLRGVESSITNQLGPLIAVFRVVHDWNEYKDTMLIAQPCTASIAMTTITFPSPHPTSFSVAGASLVSGSPQVTVSGEPVSQPQWNQMFFFPGDVESLFARNAAIVIEFYRKTHALNDGAWMLANPVGYCSQALNLELASALKQENAKLGLRINGLAIQGLITTPSGTKASVGVVLRLLVDERPDILVAASQFSSLPLFGEQPNVNSNQFAAQPIATNDKNPFGLPPFDAVQRLLPFSNPQPAFGTSQPSMFQSTLPSNDAELSSVPLELRNTMDVRTLALLDYQMKEVDRYRTAMRKVAADLLHLKQENSRLEEANSRYRRDLSQHDEISRMMISANDLDNVTHSELIQKFVLLKKKLSEESTKRQELQKRVQNLQNDLIKKNEKAKSLVKLEEAHESQQALLQKMQAKLQKYKALQDTCKKQEQVIVELEKLLSKGENGLNLTDSDGSSRLYIEENVRLRLELERFKGMIKDRDAKEEVMRGTSPKKDDANAVVDNSMKLELYQKLERSEGRILGLEKQLAENARKWAKEKTALQARLNELQMEKQTGFSSLNATRFTPDVIAHSSSNNLFIEPRKSSPKLDPLTRKWP